MTPTTKTSPETAARQSTYSLLISSEEKERNIFETVIYALFIICAVVGVWQFVQQPVPVRTHISNEEPTLAISVCDAGNAGC